MKKLFASIILILFSSLLWGQNYQVVGPIADKGGQVYNVKAYGATGDGVTDDYECISAAHTAATVAGGVVFFPPGTYRIATNITFNSNVTAAFANSAKFSIDAAVTLTLNGSIDAGLDQVFSGSGSVALSKVKEVYPQWWGAVADQITDDQPAIQAAIDAVGGGGIVSIGQGVYIIGSPIILGNGKGLIGAGGRHTVLKAGNSFNAEAGHAIVQNFLGAGDPAIDDSHAPYVRVEGIYFDNTISNDSAVMLWLVGINETSWVKDVSFKVADGTTLKGALWVQSAYYGAQNYTVESVTTYGATGRFIDTGIYLMGSNITFNKCNVLGHLHSGTPKSNPIKISNYIYANLSNLWVEGTPGGDTASIYLRNVAGGTIVLQNSATSSVDADSARAIEVDVDSNNGRQSRYEISNFALKDSWSTYVYLKKYDGQVEDITKTSLGIIYELSGISLFNNLNRLWKGNYTEDSLLSAKASIVPTGKTSNIVPYTARESMPATDSGSTWTSSVVLNYTYLWEIVIRLSGSGGTVQRFYKVFVSNYYTSPQYNVNVTDLGGTTATATFDVDITEGYTKHKLIVTIGGGVAVSGDLVYRRLN